MCIFVDFVDSTDDGDLLGVLGGIEEGTGRGPVG